MPFPGLRGRILVAVPGLAAFLAVILWGGPTASLALFALLAGLAAYEAVTLCVVATPIPLRFMVGSAAALSTLLTGVGSQYAMQALMLPGAVHAMWWISRRTPEGARAGMLGVMALTAYYTLGFGVLARLSLGWADRAPVLIRWFPAGWATASPTSRGAAGEGTRCCRSSARRNPGRVSPRALLVQWHRWPSWAAVPHPLRTFSSWVCCAEWPE